MKRFIQAKEVYMRAGKKTGVNLAPKESLGKRMKKHWEFYLLLLPGIIITIIYKYIPIYGVQIAFRDYNAMDGFFGSPWVGLEWFERFFSSYNSVRMIRNTVLLSLLQYFVDVSDTDHSGASD